MLVWTVSLYSVLMIKLMVFIFAGVGGHFSPCGGVEGGSYAAIRPFCAFGLLLFGSPVVALNVLFSARRLFLKMLNSSLSSSLFTLSLALGKDWQLTFPPDFCGVGSFF